jgi:hypothetical protein
MHEVPLPHDDFNLSLVVTVHLIQNKNNKKYSYRTRNRQPVVTSLTVYSEAVVCTAAEVTADNEPQCAFYLHGQKSFSPNSKACVSDHSLFFCVSDSAQLEELRISEICKAYVFK